jgi:uncharacterized protein YcaQ
MGRDTLSAAEARRVALAAQGFGRKRPRKATAGDLANLTDRLGALQIDSVNVLARAHYFPWFSRAGPYKKDILENLAYRKRRLFEYWGHQASFLPVSRYPLFGPRMRKFADPALDPDSIGAWGRYVKWARNNDKMIEALYREISDRGPSTAGQLSKPRTKTRVWWDWTDEKLALEWLFRIGRIAVHSRNNFERLYDLTERVIPAQFLGDGPGREEAQRELLMIAARACGVATSDDLAEYFSIAKADGRPRVRELVEEGRLQEVGVEGWSKPAYLIPGTRIPMSIDARALVSPFDSLVWTRNRVERLFGFHYRIEIYVPAPKRVHGYYVLPFLLGDRLVGRLDLKADRAKGALLVQAAHQEDGEDAAELGAAMADELALMAAWLGLDSISVARKGNAAGAVKKALTRSA